MSEVPLNSIMPPEGREEVLAPLGIQLRVKSLRLSNTGLYLWSSYTGLYPQSPQQVLLQGLLEINYTHRP